jgi:hypothetical protein
LKALNFYEEAKPAASSSTSGVADGGTAASLDLMSSRKNGDFAWWRGQSTPWRGQRRGGSPPFQGVSFEND